MTCHPCILLNYRCGLLSGVLVKLDQRCAQQRLSRKSRGAPHATHQKPAGSRTHILFDCRSQQHRALHVRHRTTVDRQRLRMCCFRHLQHVCMHVCMEDNRCAGWLSEHCTAGGTLVLPAYCTGCGSCTASCHQTVRYWQVHTHQGLHPDRGAVSALFVM
jgi:hypothetical protein